jgi:hypothetical protein
MGAVIIKTADGVDLDVEVHGDGQPVLRGFGRSGRPGT